MLITEAHIELETVVDKRSTSQVPELPPELKDYFINEAYRRFVKTRYNKNNIYKASFEEIQKRTEDLKELVRTELVPTIAVPYEADETTWPASQLDISSTTLPYWFYLRSRCRIVKENCPDEWSSPKLVQQDDLETVLDDPFNNPSDYNPVIYFEAGNILVRTAPDYTVPEMKLTFIKEPLKVNVGTYGDPVQEFEISEHTHNEIVQMAADIILENIESRRIQTIKQQLAQIE